MGTNIRFLIAVCIIICFASISDAAIGIATFYKPPYVPSACHGYEEKGIYIAAASDSMWENGAACGKLYSVSCIGATNQVAPPPCKDTLILVPIVDYCPPGCHGDINLSEDAFSMIADLNAGRILVNYTDYI